MRNISLFKKLKFFNIYKKCIKNYKKELWSEFKIRVDSAWRIYTVVNIPESIIGEAYSIRKDDIDRISQTYIKEYVSGLSKFLNSKGLKELFDYYDVKKVDKYSYLIVIGFSLFKTNEFYNNIYYKLIPIMVLLATTLILIFR
jgi:hypothetical protein